MTETEKKVRETGTLIIKIVTGSTAFGLNTPTSDVDIRGVYVLPWKDRLRQDVGDQIADEKNDETYWEITKFFRELAKANPQALEITGLLDVSVFFSWVYYKTKGYKKSLMHWIFPMHKASSVLCSFSLFLLPAMTIRQIVIFRLKGRGKEQFANYSYSQNET